MSSALDLLDAPVGGLFPPALSFLSWNVRGNEGVNLDWILSLILKRSCAVVLLTEVDEDESHVRSVFEGQVGWGVWYKFLHPKVGSMVLLYDKSIIDVKFNDVDSGDRWFMFKCSFMRIDFCLYCVHFRSKINGEYSYGAAGEHQIDQMRNVNRFKSPSIILGDFNGNPSEDILSSHGPTKLRGVMCKDYVLNYPNSEYGGGVVPNFYNPCWGIWGSSDKIKGSYYYPNGRYVWEAIDQVLFSSDIVRLFEVEDVSYLSDGDFYDSKKHKILKSDHLPLSFVLKYKPRAKK